MWVGPAQRMRGFCQCSTRFMQSSKHGTWISSAAVSSSPRLSLSSGNYGFKGLRQPGGRIPCNLNFDDLCPKYLDECGLDFGENIENGLYLKIKKLLEEFSHIALTFFVIPNCMLQIQHSSFLPRRNFRDRYDIASPAHARWLQYYKDLSRKYNIGYGKHGYYHRQFENIFCSPYRICL